MVPSSRTPRGRQKAEGAAPRAEKKPKSENTRKTQAATCQATTVKGTQCRLKPQEGSDFCARHADLEKTPKSGASPGKNGKRTAKKRTAKKPVETKEATSLNGSRKKDPKASGKKTPAPAPEPPAPTPEGPAPPTQKEEVSPEPEDEPEGDLDSAFYGSEFSTTMEASPYDDLITPEMAEGEEDVELRDEREFGRDSRPPRRPRLSREEAEKKARERLGPAPEIAPEEDIDGTLQKYENRFENEVRRILGIAPRGRGRRGGRRRGRGGGGGGGPGGGGPGGGGGPRRGGGGGGGRKRRGRRGGRAGRGRRDDDGPRSGGPSRRSGPTGGAARKVARDSPLAQKRGSKGPKRGVQPRRRREPDV